MGCLRGWRVALRGAPRQHANRVYYGMFYAVLALLIYEPYASSKHSGVLAYFNKHFVKSKKTTDAKISINTVNIKTFFTV